MTHEIKIQKQFAEAVYLGEKTFEVRNNDRGYQKGDLVKFQVMDGWFERPTHPLNDMTFKITYVLGSFYGLAQGYVAFGIKPMPEQTETKGVRYCNECKWFRDKQVCGRCRSKNLFAEADTPQTDCGEKMQTVVSTFDSENAKYSKGAE